MKGGLKMKVQGLKTRKAAPAAEYKGEQKGSLLLEAIVVLGMIATFTPMLYKHVADRRADIENINRANTLLYLQHKAEDYLKDPDNITALVTELGHNQHKEIYPSEMGAGSNFDGRYIVGIRREDEENKPVLKAMIIDTVHTGSDLRAAKVAELIGISAGIYTAVDPDAAWGINGIWSEPLSRYFDTTNIPTGAVAITTEYNKAKYRVNISDILVDADLDMGEFEVTAEQINAVAIAAQNGTLDQLIASNEVTSPKISATERFCFKKENGTEDCIESWEGMGGGGQNVDTSELKLVQECNAGITDSCSLAFSYDLNTTCSKVDAVFDRFGVAYPNPKVYRLTYGDGPTYVGSALAKCEGTSFVVENISTSTLSSPVEQVGDSAFVITQPGWYQVTLRGEASGAGGGLLIANTYYDIDTLITLKGIRGGIRPSVSSGIVMGGTHAGAGVALWDNALSATGAPKLAAGGGGNWAVRSTLGPNVTSYSGGLGGGGYYGGNWTGSPSAPNSKGYSWNGSTGGSSYSCNTAPCNSQATGGYRGNGDGGGYGGSGTGSSGYPCPSGHTCTTITGGASGKGYASIVYCGATQSACPTACTSDSDCSGEAPVCQNAICKPRSCSTDSDCPDPEYPSCNDGVCSIPNCTSDSDCSDETPYCDSNTGRCTATRSCTADSDCFGTTPYCTNNQCSAYPRAGAIVFSAAEPWYRPCKDLPSENLGSITLPAGKYQFDIRGGSGYTRLDVSLRSGGGTLMATKTFRNPTTLQVKSIQGYTASGFCGGSGIGLFEEGIVKAVAGGGAIWYWAGGGYVGGAGTSSHNGYSWDGTRGNSTATFGIGNGGSSGTTSTATTYGGTGYCASDYSCTGTYGTNPGVAYIVITYCGDANSTCP